MFLHHVVVVARIEPLSKAGEEILQLGCASHEHPVQKAWLDEDTGYLWNLWEKDMLSSNFRCLHIYIHQN